MSDSLLKNKIIICYWWSQSLKMPSYVTNVCILCYSFKRPGVSCQMKSLINISSLLNHAFSIAFCLIFGVSEIGFSIPRLNITYIYIFFLNLNSHATIQGIKFNLTFIILIYLL